MPDKEREDAPLKIYESKPRGRPRKMEASEEITQGVTVEEFVPEEKPAKPEHVLVEIKGGGEPRKPYLSKRTLLEIKRGQEQLRKYAGLEPDGTE